MSGKVESLSSPEEVTQLNIKIPRPHSKSQEEFVRCTALRQVLKAGRRFGKTYGVAIKALEAFLGVCVACGGEGCVLCDNTGKVPLKRVLYATPTAEQITKFWFEVTRVLNPGVALGVYKKDETEKFIEVPGTEIRIRAKTAWNANTLRGDFANLLILDEYQIMNEDTWEGAGQPTLIDKRGTAVFIFTPPSLKSEGVSKAKDPRHASKLFKKYSQDTSGIWKTFHFTTYDNPKLNKDAIAELKDSWQGSIDTFNREILAQDDEIESSWLVYGKFDETLCKIKRFEIPKEWPVLSGHDFGTANPAALFVAQVKLPLPPNAPPYLRYGDYVAFQEYSPGAGYSPLQHVDKFKEFTKDLRLESAVGGNVTTEEETRILYRRLGWPIKAPLITHVAAQVDRALQIVEHNQLYVFEDLHKFLGQIAECMWIVDENKQTTNKIKDEAKFHLLAAWRYLATILHISNVSSDEANETKWD